VIEPTGLLRFVNDTNIRISVNKKAGDWVFSKYRKDKSTGLILTCKDSIMFVNDNFFASDDLSEFYFADSVKMIVRQQQNYEDKTVRYKYIFNLNVSSKKWLLCYAEKKEIAGERCKYLFTDSFQQDFSMENFATEHFFSDLFVSGNKNLFRYAYKNKNYLDSISIQVNNMRLSNVVSFKNVFTVEHAEEILQDYPINNLNVTLLNNIAYYLEQMSIVMPAITILEPIIDVYPNRTVSYRNLGDALTKNNLKIKANKIVNK
jgi:hypothetical protein